MSLGSSNMAGNTLGTAFSLLFLASITQANVEMPHYKTMEAVVGQDVTLPCTMNGGAEIVNIEWSKKNEENTKLVVYCPHYGLHQFQPNVTIEIEKNDAGKVNSFPLKLSAVTKWDSGIYICRIASFPLGSLTCEAELKIKEADELTCDVNSTVEAQSGENVTIHCRTFPNAQYRWTKNKNLVSKTESLELWKVTDAHAGVYTLTVNTGTKTMHKEFNITVLTVTTSLSTGLVTAVPQPNVTSEGLIHSTDNSLTTSPTTHLPSTDTSVTLTVTKGTDVADRTTNPSNVTFTAEERKTTFTDDTHISVTSSTAEHTDPYHSLNSTTLSNSSAVFSPTQETDNDETTNESTTHRPSAGNVSLTPEESSSSVNLTENCGKSSANLKTKNGVVVEDNKRSHLLVLIIVPVLVLIVVVGELYRRHIIKKRMDLPPPFKPPPPPVKYTTARHSEISAKSFPISRCNSVTELMI